MTSFPVFAHSLILFTSVDSVECCRRKGQVATKDVQKFFENGEKKDVDGEEDYEQQFQNLAAVDHRSETEIIRTV